MPVVQIVWGRYLFHFLFLAAFVFARTGFVRVVRTGRLGLQLGRSVLLVCSTAIFWLALVYLPLAQAIAIGFASPLIPTALPALRPDEAELGSAWCRDTAFHDV